MSFSSPWLLATGVVATLLITAGFLRLAERRRRLADFLGGRRATDRMGRRGFHRTPTGRIVLLAGAALCLAVSAAGPRWTEESATPASPDPPTPSVILAIDISASMQADDVEPTRLGRGTKIARELLETLGHARVGLILFSGTPYTLAPPTEDHEVLAYLLDGVAPDLVNIYDPGSLPSAVLREATSFLETAAEPGSDGPGAASGDDGAPRGSGDSLGAGDSLGDPSGLAGPEGSRTLVVLGDGEAGEPTASVREAAVAAAEKGIRIHAVGVGTARGGRLVLPAGYTRKGLDGSGPRGPMVSRLEEGTLRQLAEIGGGIYAPADDPDALARIHRSLEETVPEPPVDSGAPLWARFDPGTLMVVLALTLLLAEGLWNAGVIRGPRASGGRNRNRFGVWDGRRGRGATGRTSTP